jgi:paraquat-inducible protein B
LGKNKDGRFHFIEKWKEETKKKIRLVRPDIPEEKLDELLEKKIDERFKDHKCQVHNNHKDKTAETSLLQLTQFLEDTKPIIAGNGTLYKNQYDAYNPNRQMLLDYKTTRTRLKKERKQFDERSYQFMVRDIGQDNVKRLMNSFYGASLAKSSTFYNKYCGASVTATGQALISTSMTSFEQLMMNNSKFFDMDEFMLFVERVLHETEYKHLDIIQKIDNIDEKVEAHIIDSFLYKEKINYKIRNLIRSIICTCCSEIMKLF